MVIAFRPVLTSWVFLVTASFVFCTICISTAIAVSMQHCENSWFRFFHRATCIAVRAVSNFHSVVCVCARVRGSTCMSACASCLCLSMRERVCLSCTVAKAEIHLRVRWLTHAMVIVFRFNQVPVNLSSSSRRAIVAFSSSAVHWGC